MCGTLGGGGLCQLLPGLYPRPSPLHCHTPTQGLSLPPKCDTAVVEGPYTSPCTTWASVISAAVWSGASSIPPRLLCTQDELDDAKKEVKFKELRSGQLIERLEQALQDEVCVGVPAGFCDVAPAVNHAMFCASLSVSCQPVGSSGGITVPEARG